MALYNTPNRAASERSSPRRNQLHDGRDKILYDGAEAGTYVLYFKDQSFFQQQPIEMAGRGVLSNRISDLWMTRLGDMGIETHLIRQLNMREQLVRATEVYPFRVTVYNVATGAFAEKMQLAESQLLPFPLPELQMRHIDDEHKEKHGTVVLSPQHILALGWAQTQEIEDLINIATRVNDFISGQCLALGMRLLSISLEFGRWYYSQNSDEYRILLIDEISPDTCEIRDLRSGERLDRSLLDTEGLDAVNSGRLIESYRTIARRLGLLEDTQNPIGLHPLTEIETEIPHAN